MIINNNNRIELFFNTITLYNGNEIEQIFRTDLVQSVSPVDESRVRINFISGDYFMMFFQSYIGFETLKTTEAIIKLSTLLGLAVSQIGKNKFRFNTGTSPSVEDLASALNIGKFENPIKIDDTIYFDNADYQIPSEAFRYATDIIEVISLATEVGFTAFQNNTSLEIAIFDNATIIRDGAFVGCTNLKSIGIRSAVQLESAAFQSCESITVVFAPKLEIIGYGAFNSAKALQKLQLPSLQQLGDSPYNDNVFVEVTGNDIDLTIPAALMTVREGEPDGDLTVLLAYNNVTLKTV